MQAILEPITKQRTAQKSAFRRSYFEGDVVTLHGVTYDTYTRLANELTDSQRPRIFYTNRILELRMPSEEHEEVNRIAALLVALIFGEWDVEVRDLGSKTHDSPETEKGFEPDTCFYRDDERDGETFSVPLLAIETEVSHSAIDKLAVYAAFGMPELWRLTIADEGTIQAHFYILRNGTYFEEETSSILAPLTPTLLTEFLTARLTDVRLGAWIKSVQKWAQDTRKSVP